MYQRSQKAILGHQSLLATASGGEFSWWYSLITPRAKSGSVLKSIQDTRREPKRAVNRANGFVGALFLVYGEKLDPNLSCAQIRNLRKKIGTEICDWASEFSGFERFAKCVHAWKCDSKSGHLFGWDLWIRTMAKSKFIQISGISLKSTKRCYNSIHYINGSVFPNRRPQPPTLCLIDWWPMASDC